MTLAYGVLRGGGVCARVGDQVVDLSGLDPVFDAPSLNAFMAAGPEVWRQAASRVDEGRELAECRAGAADRGGGLRGLLLVARPRDEPRPHVPAGRRAPASELAAPARGLPRAGRDGGAERDAGAAPERPAPRPGVRAERAPRHRAGGRLRDRHAEHDGRAGADRARARPRVRHGARERLVRARHPGLGVPAARPVPRQVVRHVGEPLGRAARPARRPARAARGRRTRSRSITCARSPGPSTSRSRSS